MTQLLIISPPPSSPLHLSDRLAFCTGPTRGIELLSAFLFVIFQLLFNAFVGKIIAKTLNVLFDWERFFWQTSRCNYPHDTTVNSSSSGSHPHQKKDKTKKDLKFEDVCCTVFPNIMGSITWGRIGKPMIYRFITYMKTICKPALQTLKRVNWSWDDQDIIGVIWSNWEHKQLQLPSPRTFWKFISQTNTMEEKEVTTMHAYTIHWIAYNPNSSYELNLHFLPRPWWHKICQLNKLLGLVWEDESQNKNWV